MQPVGNGVVAADGHPETADRPQQELHIPLNIAVVGVRHFRRSVDAGAANRKVAIIALHRNGDRHGRPLAVGIGPDPKGNKTRIQRGNIFMCVRNAQVLHKLPLFMLGLPNLTCHSGNDPVHFVPFFLHIRYQCHLAAGTDQVMVCIFDLGKI